MGRSTEGKEGNGAGDWRVEGRREGGREEGREEEKGVG
jgi:hypothetical protein